MSDITPAVQQQLTQALSQLIKTQGDSPIARQAAQVIVQYLGGNQLNLSIDKNSRPITLDKFASLPASLKPGTYSGEIGTSSQGKQSASLAIYAKTASSSNQSLLARLNQNQLAAILSAISQDVQPGTTSKSHITDAKIVNIVGQQVTLSTQVNGKPQQIALRLTPLPADLKVGQSVQLQLIPKGNGWQVNILSTTASPQSGNLGNASSSSGSSSNNGVTNTPLNNAPIRVSKESAITILQADSIKNTKQILPNVLSVEKNALVSAIVKSGVSLPTQTFEQLNNIPATKEGQRVSVVINPQSGGELRANINLPVATLPLSKQQLQQIQSVALEIQSKSATKPANTAVTNTPHTDNALQKTQSDTRHIVASTPLDTEKINQVAIDKGMAGTAKDSVAMLSTTQKNELVKLINDISRRLLPASASPAESIDNIVKALSDQALHKEPTSKIVTETLLKQIQNAVPQGKASDAENIKQMLTQPILNLSPAQIVQPSNSGQGLVAGLITLLQVNLASRLARTSPAQSEKVAQIISTILGPSIKQSTNQSQRTLGDVQQLDQKHQLFKQLGRLFAQHQSAKLVGAEQAMQGQEGLYYVLPSGTSENRRDIELLIRREPEKNNQNKADQSKQAIWHLTMKLDIGEIGQLLTKAKLRDTELELDLYTSNEALKTLVFEYLPLFKKRLQSLGIEVSKSMCQLGKIPEHLHSRPYQIFETQA